MPYIKEHIGAVPYYVPKEQTTLFGIKNCDIGVNVHRENTSYGCFLTYLDIYGATTKIRFTQ
jgi:hypothetical protein